MTIRKYPTKTFTPCPAGLHQAVCVDVVDLGDQPTSFGIRPQVRLVWQIADVNPATLRRYDVIKTCTDSMAPKATFRKLVESWLGTHLTEAQAKAFDSDRLIGANCQLQVLQRTSDKTGDVYAVVEALFPPVKGAVPLKPLDYVRRPTPPSDPTVTAVPSLPPPRPAAPAAAMPITSPHESEELDSEFNDQSSGDSDWDDFITAANDEDAG